MEDSWRFGFFKDLSERYVWKAMRRTARRLKMRCVHVRVPVEEPVGVVVVIVGAAIALVDAFS